MQTFGGAVWEDQEPKIHPLFDLSVSTSGVCPLESKSKMQTNIDAYTSSSMHYLEDWLSSILYSHKIEYYTFIRINSFRGKMLIILVKRSTGICIRADYEPSCMKARG